MGVVAFYHILTRSIHNSNVRFYSPATTCAQVRFASICCTVSQALVTRSPEYPPDTAAYPSVF